MKLKILLSTTFFYLVLQFNLQAQINPKGVAPGLMYSHKPVEVKMFPLQISVEKLLQEDKSGVRAGVPYRTGVSVPIETNFFELGEWISISDGRKFFQVRLSSPNAHALSIAFDNFYIPEGGQLFFYSPDKEIMYGGYTNDDNHESRMFQSPLFISDEVVVEYFEPEKSKVKETPFLNVMELAHHYKSVSEHLKNDKIGESEPCMINVNCSEGDNWQVQKRGVARIYLKEGSSYGWCSGTLVNNTAQDGTPYFLTADHCGGTASAADHNLWVFRFNYERPGCEDTGTPATQNITGCSLKAIGSIDGGSDMQLVKLNFTPPSSFLPYYNGWDRSFFPSQSGVCIHHPAGDVKKISTFSATATNVANPIISDSYMAANSAWNVTFVATANGRSVTEGGSSGSPLFNQNKLVVGTLTGGSSTCSYPQGSNVYGKLHYHWDLNGLTPTDQLKPWLDPLGTNQLTLEGLDLYPVPTPKNLEGKFNSNFTVSLNWEKPAYDQFDSWFGNVNNYSSVRSETPERATKFELTSSLGIETFYIKKLSHIFWKHPSYPWGANTTFTFKVYGSDGETLLYESPVITALDYNTTAKPVIVHELSIPIEVTGDFFVSIAPVSSGQPSSLALEVQGITNSFYGSPGSWAQLTQDSKLYELTTSVYGSENNSDKNITSDDDLIILGVDQKQFEKSVEKEVSANSKVITNLMFFNVFRDDALIYSTSNAQTFEYTDTYSFTEDQTYKYHTTAIYNLNPPNAANIESSKSNEIFITANPVGISAINSDAVQFTIYPNPSNGIFNVITPDFEGIALLTINDVAGKEIFRKLITANPEKAIVVTGLKSGIYLTYLSFNNEILVAKLVLN